MLAENYSKGYNSEKLFAGLKIRQNEKFETRLNKYNVTFGYSMDVQEYTWGNKKKFFSWNDELYSKAGNAALKKRYSECVGDTDIS